MSGYQRDQGKLQSPGVTKYNDYVYYPLFSRLSCETEEKTIKTYTKTNTLCEGPTEYFCS